jgi:hypothetical protein
LGVSTEPKLNSYLCLRKERIGATAFGAKMYRNNFAQVLILLMVTLSFPTNRFEWQLYLPASQTAQAGDYHDHGGGGASAGASTKSETQQLGAL